MKKRLGFIITVLLSVPVIISAGETISTCNSGVNGVECQKISKKYTSSNGNTDSDMYQFKSSKGYHCDIKGYLSSSDNAKLAYSSTHTSKDGSWTGSGLLVRQKSKKRAYKYSLAWDITCGKKGSTVNSKGNSKGNSKNSLNNSKNTSASGVWMVTIAGMKGKFTLNRSGNGSFYGKGNSYPLRWRSNGNKINIRVYGTKTHYNRDDPGNIVNLTMDGRRISGTQTSPAFPQNGSLSVNGKKQ